LIQQSARSVRLPSPVQDQLRRYRRSEERLAARVPGTPALELGRELGVSPEEADRLALLDQPVLRLDAAIAGREGLFVADRLADDAAECGAEADRLRVEGEVARLLERLPQRERTILRARFGFEDGEELTLQQVAKGLGLSRERVRQLEKRALDRLLLAASEAGLDDWVHG
jgi:RNA polymerase sigma factor (sigma-70 family)